MAGLDLAPVAAPTGQEAQRALTGIRPVLVVLDLASPGFWAPDVLRDLTGDDRRVPIVALSRDPGPEAALEAIRHGALDVLDKGQGPAQLAASVAPLVQTSGRWLVGPGEQKRSLVHAYARMFRCSARMHAVERLVRQAAATDSTILVEGEAGVGKEDVGRLIHHLSARAEGPVVRVNCAALPPPMLEAELFGYERAAVPRAKAAKAGQLEFAEGGTLVLEEIGELSLEMQSRVLRFLEDREFYRSGGYHMIAGDVRVVATSRGNLRDMMGAGSFRRELYDRIDLTIQVPPLRARPGEVPLLVEHYLGEFAHAFSVPRPALSTGAAALLAAYSWPGNVREVESVIKRYVVLGDEQHLRDEILTRMPAAAKDVPVRRPARLAVGSLGEQGLRNISRRAAAEAEKTAILRVLEDVGGNRAEAARRLRVSYKTLLNKLREREEETGGACER